jgi:hypothetical protein
MQFASLCVPFPVFSDISWGKKPTDVSIFEIPTNIEGIGNVSTCDFSVLIDSQKQTPSRESLVGQHYSIHQKRNRVNIFSEFALYLNSELHTFCGSWYLKIYTSCSELFCTVPVSLTQNYCQRTE